MLPKPILDQFSSQAFREFLDARADPLPGEPYGAHLHRLALSYVDADLAQIYGRLACLMKVAPSLETVFPRMTPVSTAQDPSAAIGAGPTGLHLKVRLVLGTREPAQTIHLGEGAVRFTQDQSCVHAYGYREYPSSFDLAARAAFDKALEACEALNLGVWGDVCGLRLFTRAEPYRSVQDLEQDMAADLGGFEAEVNAWALDQSLAAATPDASRPPRM